MEGFQGYELQSFLGSGSFGVVWKVRKAEDENGETTPLALKVILVDPENEAKQKRELKLSVKLSHQNLIQVYKVEETLARKETLATLVPLDDENCQSIIFALRRNVLDFKIFCLELQLCGESLRKWLSEEHDPASNETISTQTEILTNIFEGLNYLHEKRIVHRDLKPENILFSEESYITPVKIGDYGTCRIMMPFQSSSLTSRVGTELYRAPEASLAKELSFQSDLFSLGLVLWEVLQLIRFQDLRSYFDKLVNDKEEEIVRFHDSFSHWKYWVIKMCQRKVTERPLTLSEILLSGNKKLGTGIFVARNSEELQQVLRESENGWTIQLLEGSYRGRFEITRKGIIIKGKGEKTVFRPVKIGETVLIVRGVDFKGSDFKLHGEDASPEGILIRGKNCSLENLWISYSQGVGIEIYAENAHLNNLHFLEVTNPISVSGNDAVICNVDIDDCHTGLRIWKVQRLLVSSCCVTDPAASGIQIRESFEVQILNANITLVSKTGSSAERSRPLSGIALLECRTGKVELTNVICKGFDGVNDCDLFLDHKSLSADVVISDSPFQKIVKDTEGRYD